jgi:hypothetical protein
MHQTESFPRSQDMARDEPRWIKGCAMRQRALLLLAACGLFQVGLGMYFIALRPAMLPEDERFTGLSLNAITQVSPSIPIWLDRVFIVLGGHAVATGFLITLAVILLWNRAVSLMALALIATAGGASVVLMSATNFAIDSDFRWLLLLPALAWAGAVVLLAREWVGGEWRGAQAADTGRLRTTEGTNQ